MTNVTPWLSGIGLHSGLATHARICIEDGPLRVRRVDGARSEAIVSLTSARPIPRTSRIALSDGRTVEMVEHIFAPLMASRRFRNLVVEVDGPEVPLLDGGASQWSDALEAIRALEPQEPLQIVKPWCDEFEGMMLRLEPGEFQIAVTTDFRHHKLDARTTFWDGSWKSFREHIAPARAFGFYSEARALWAAGRALGIDRRSLVVFDDEGKPDPTFAAPFPNEVHSHKLLDFIGDLALIGQPITGRIEASKPGHSRTLHLLRAALRDGAFGAVARVPPQEVAKDHLVDR